MVTASQAIPFLDANHWNDVIDFLNKTVETSHAAMLAQWALAAGALVAGIWAVYTYTRSRRTSAASWLKELFRDVYLGDSFRAVRMKMEYHFLKEVAPVLQKRLTNRNVEITKDEEHVLIELDNFLNMFEVILHLESKKQISRADTFTIFRYWFYGLIKNPHHAALRLYIKEFGFNNIASLIDETKQKHDYVFFYGTLREERNPVRHRIAPHLLMDKACRAATAGFLYEFRKEGKHYPILQVLDQRDAAYAETPTVVHGCVVPIRHSDSKVPGVADEERLRLLNLLDANEGFDPYQSEGESRLVRRRIRVYIARGGNAKSPSGLTDSFLESRKDLKPVDAWVYVSSSHFSHEPGLPKIGSGDWLQWLMENQSRSDRVSPMA